MNDSMRVIIDFESSAQDNANRYYQKAKKLKRKSAGAEKAIKNLESRYEKLDKEITTAAKKVIEKREQKWYEKFHWFYTSDKFLVIGGRDAHQNEFINSKHFNNEDLFFHADIHGASTTILINGVNSEKNSKEEAAQFAGCYSSAWDNMLKIINVYSLKREQISKSTDKGSLGTGSFLMTGEREWHRNVSLELVMFIKDKILNVVPLTTFDRIDYKDKHVFIIQGNMKKSDAGKKISKFLEFDDLDILMRQLPPGTFSLKFSE